MTRGSNLRCIGIPGDGCGGGREFFIKNQTLFVFDPITKQTTPLAYDIKEATKLTKQGCKLFIQTASKVRIFNLSTFAFE